MDLSNKMSKFNGKVFNSDKILILDSNNLDFFKQNKKNNKTDNYSFLLKLYSDPKFKASFVWGKHKY